MYVKIFFTPFLVYPVKYVSYEMFVRKTVRLAKCHIIREALYMHKY